VVLYHCCVSYDRAKEIVQLGFDPSVFVRVTAHLPEDVARPPDDSHGVVVLAVARDFRLNDYPVVTGSTDSEDRLVPGEVLNKFERAVWSV